MRSAITELCEFIEAHQEEFGVVPICRALAAYDITIAANTFHAWRRRGSSKRALWDAMITEILAGYYEPDEQGRKRPESLYGSRKMWAHLNREGIPVARCTVERLLRDHSWCGVIRSKKVRTTIADPAAERAPDLVDRQFTVPASNLLGVADLTYVIRLRDRWCYTAFTIDAFAGVITGWQVRAKATAQMVEASFADGIEFRARQGRRIESGAIHHSDYAEPCVKPRNRGFACVGGVG